MAHNGQVRFRSGLYALSLHPLTTLFGDPKLALGKTLRKNLMERGVGMFTSSDSEVIIQTIAQPPAAGPETNGPDWIGATIWPL
jgi:hypothetical protein